MEQRKVKKNLKFLGLNFIFFKKSFKKRIITKNLFQIRIKINKLSFFLKKYLKMNFFLKNQIKIIDEDNFIVHFVFNLGYICR